MFTAAERYPPVLADADGVVEVRLPDAHPGGGDDAYLARRAEIARRALDWEAGPPPEIEYTAEETRVWRATCQELYLRHAHLACRAYLEGWEALGLPLTRVPQLGEVSGRLAALTGFVLVPTARGLDNREWFATLGQGRLPCWQHLRHTAETRSSPDPDHLHAVLGHAVQLASPVFARIHRRFGEVAAGLDDARLEGLCRVYWATCELGVILDAGDLQAYGAELLSSPRELEAFRHAEVHPLDLDAVAAGGVHPAVRHRVDSLAQLEAQLERHWAGLTS